jgi:creatinine amidohydrolase/Fe(II)-dependent formamide hydrolase-like protein
MVERDVGQCDAGQHAGAVETSFVIGTHPELVGRDVLACGHVGEMTGIVSSAGAWTPSPTTVS